MWSGLLLVTLAVTLRMILARREGTSWSALALATALGSAHYLTLVLPLGFAMLASALGHSVRFDPTNNRFARERDRHKSQRLGRGVAAGVMLSVLLAGAMRRPGSVLVGFNALWLIALILSPFFLRVLERLGGGRSVVR